MILKCGFYYDVKYFWIVYNPVVVIIEESNLDFPVVLEPVCFGDHVHNLPRDGIPYAVSCGDYAFVFKILIVSLTVFPVL